jgi:HEAT repeat protein
MGHTVEQLVEKATSSSGGSARQAVEELAAIGGQRAIAGLFAVRVHRGWPLNEVIDPAIVAFGEDALTVLRPALQSRQPEARKAAIWLLAEMLGNAAVGELLPLFQDPEASVRKSAANALKRVGDARAADPLAALGADADTDVRIAAGAALCALDDVRGVDILLPLLVNGAYGMFDEGVNALIGAAASGKLGRAAADKIFAVWATGSEKVRRQLIEVIVGSGDPRAAPTLLSGVLQTNSELSAEFFARGLEQLGWQPTTPEEAVWYAMAKREWEEAAAHGAVAVQPMIAALLRWEQFDGHRGTMDGLPIALARLGDARALGPLRESTSRHPRTARVAVRAMDILLTATASQTTLEDLTAVAQMRSVKEIAQVPVSDNLDMPGSSLRPGLVDCGQVAELAREELRRRGAPVPDIPEAPRRNPWWRFWRR